VVHHLYGTLTPAKRADPAVITVRDDEDSDRLVMVLPLLSRRHFLATQVEYADLGVSDYTAPLVHPDWEWECTRDPELIEQIRAKAGGADLIRLEKLRHGVESVVRMLGTTDVTEHAYRGYSIPLPSTFEEWQHQRERRVVRDVEKKRKRIGRNGRVLELRELTDPTEIDTAFDRMAEFRAARFAGKRAIDLLQDPAYVEFYRRVAHDGAAGVDPGTTWILTIDGETGAATFGLADDVRDLFLLVGYDVANWKNYSLGLVLVEQQIKVSIEHGKKFHDLGIGHGAYKVELGAVATPVYRARRALTPAGWADARIADRTAAAKVSAKKFLHQTTPARQRLRALTSRQS